MKRFFKFLLVLTLISPFSIQAMEGDIPSLKDLCIKFILENPISAKSPSVPTDLHDDVEEAEAAEFLAQNPNNPQMALRAACENKASIGAIRHLAMVVKKTDHDLLFYAAESNHIPLLQSLIEDNINIHLYDELELRSAVNNGNFEAAELLIKYGADINHRYKGGETLIMLAVEKNDTRTLSWLLQKIEKPLINERGNQGRTALLLAAMYGHNAVIQLLLDNGADINIPDNKNNTALDYAIQCQASSTIELLKKNKAINNKYVLWLGKAGIWDVYSKKKVHFYLGSAAVIACLGLLKYLRK